MEDKTNLHQKFKLGVYYPANTEKLNELQKLQGNKQLTEMDIQEILALRTKLREDKQAMLDSNSENKLKKLRIQKQHQYNETKVLQIIHNKKLYRMLVVRYLENCLLQNKFMLKKYMKDMMYWTVSNAYTCISCLIIHFLYFNDLCFVVVGFF